MSRDIDTEKGQTFVEHERRMLARLSALYPGLCLTHTPLEADAALDLVITEQGAVTAVAEIKCRQEPLAQFAQWGSLVLTATKVKALSAVSEALAVRGYVILYSITDDDVRVSLLTDRTGAFMYPFPSRVSRTQATCNGGEADRLNAYLPWRVFRELRDTDFR